MSKFYRIWGEFFLIQWNISECILEYLAAFRYYNNRLHVRIFPAGLCLGCTCGPAGRAPPTDGQVPGRCTLLAWRICVNAERPMPSAPVRPRPVQSNNNRAQEVRLELPLSDC